MQSFIELIYIDNDEQACHTNLRTAAASNAATLAAFREYKRYGVDIKVAKFLVDYHNAKGDLSDTIAIDADGFRAITGINPLTDEEYRQIDSDFWNSVRSEAA